MEDQVQPKMEKNQVLAISLSHGNINNETAEKSIHLLTLNGYAFTEMQAKHMIGVIINLAKTWGLDIYKVENPQTGEVEFDAFAQQQEGGSNATH